MIFQTLADVRNFKKGNEYFGTILIFLSSTGVDAAEKRPSKKLKFGIFRSLPDGDLVNAAAARGEVD